MSGRTIAIVIVGLSLLVAAAAAANAPGRAVVDDWYDNGKLDGSWSCDRLLDGLTSLSEDRRPGYFSMRDDIERQLRARCAAWKGTASELETTPSEASIQFSSGRTAVFESNTTREASLTEFNSADADLETTDYPVPWDIVITGLLAGGLTILIGAVLASQRRLRP